jgi:hypothetical protein
MTTYPALRQTHLIAGLFSAGMLVMYGLSAVQMAHPSWIPIHRDVREWKIEATPGLEGGRAVARDLYSRGVRGELNGVEETTSGWSLVVGLPGTEHRVTYDRRTGVAGVRTTTLGFFGVLNRLHHAAGFWHESEVMKAWAGLVAAVSFAVLLMGATGLWMWFARRQDRIAGIVLLALNLAFAFIVLGLLRQEGP